MVKRHVAPRSVAAMVIDLRQHLGRLGERLGREHLERLGYRVVASNYRTRFGELDLIVCDDTTIVFVEVKARRVEAAVPPLQSVPPCKQRQVRRMAAAWLVESSDRPRARELRFDVVGVLVRGDRPALVTHLRAAFS